MADKVLGLDNSAEHRSGREGADTTGAVVAWLGFVLTAAAVTDFALALYPPLLGSPEWEFATISDIVAGLPLLTIGLGALWVGGGWLGRRWLVIATGVGFLVGALSVFAALLLFATNIPVALRATETTARGGIMKLVVKTLLLGVLFGTTYVIAGVASLRRSRSGNLQGR